MSEVEIADFRLKYKHIIWLKYELHRANAWISSVTYYDKYGSHRRAILEAMDIKDGIKKKLNDALGTKTFKQWQDRAKLITTIKGKIRTTKISKPKWIQELSDLTTW